mgnify:FL=1
MTSPSNSNNNKTLVRYIDQRGVIQSVNVSLRETTRATVVAVCNKINIKSDFLWPCFKLDCQKSLSRRTFIF